MLTVSFNSTLNESIHNFDIILNFKCQFSSKKAIIYIHKKKCFLLFTFTVYQHQRYYPELIEISNYYSVNFTAEIHFSVKILNQVERIIDCFSNSC